MDEQGLGASVAEDGERQARRRRQAKVGYSIFAVLTLIAAFSTPWYIVLTLAFGAYAVYLQQGGEIILWGSLRPRVRSRAWAYYAVIAVFGVIVAFSHPITLLVTLVAGIYSVYLYRGGRWVIWFW